MQATTLVSGELSLALKEATAKGEKSYLSGQRRIASLDSKCIELVRIGAEKPVWNPVTSYWLGSSFPEAPLFFKLSQCLEASTVAYFAEGKPDSAAQTLALHLSFARKLKQSGGALNFFIGVKVQKKAFELIAAHLIHLTPTGTEKLLAESEKNLISNPLPQVLDFEYKGKEQSLKPLVEKPKQSLLEIGIKESEIETERNGELNIYASWCELTEEKRRTLYFGALEAVKKQNRDILNQLSNMEYEWDMLPQTNLTPAEFLSLQLVPLITDFDQNEWGQFLANEAIWRTQSRLGILTCRLVLQRWKTGQLPSQLESIGEKKETYDPLHNSSFVYRPRPKSFELFSHGNGRFAKISLSEIEMRGTNDR